VIFYTLDYDIRKLSVIKVTVSSTHIYTFYFKNRYRVKFKILGNIEPKYSLKLIDLCRFVDFSRFQTRYYDSLNTSIEIFLNYYHFNKIINKLINNWKTILILTI